MMKIAVICVLKSGGDFTPSDVGKLKIMLGKNTTVPYRFYCLTDVHGMNNCVETLPLLNNYPGWWSKIELFRDDLVEADRIVYFDLDTIILANIDDLLLQDKCFIGLRPFNLKRSKWEGYVASAILSWHNNSTYNFIFNDFNYVHHSSVFKGDQDYISNILTERDKLFYHWQDLVSGICSYKRHVRSRGLLEGMRVVCFHGFPRPYDLRAHWIENALV